MQEHRNKHQEAINFVHYLVILKRRWRIVVAIVCVVTMLSVVYSLTATKQYCSRAVIMPLQRGGGGKLASLAGGGMGGLMSLAGISLPGNKALRQFVALLESRTLAEKVIKDLDLMAVLIVKDKEVTPSDKIPNGIMERAVRALKGRVKFVNDKKKETIVVNTKTKDPVLSARIANGYIEKLQEFINDNALTTAKRNRLFIEGQLAQNQVDLLEAGKELSQFYRPEGVSSVESVIDVPIARDVANNINQNIVQASSDDVDNELRTLMARKESLEKKIRNEIVVERVPHQVYLRYLKLRETLLGRMSMLLTQQYEMAKIEESRDEPSFQFLDVARAPTFRCEPKRRSIVTMAFMLSAVFAIFLVFILEYIKNVKAVMRKND